MTQEPAGQGPTGEVPVGEATASQATAGDLPDAGEVVEVLREIVAEPEFATFEDPDVWRVFWDWVATKFGQVIAWLQQLVGDQSGVAEVLVALVVVLALVVGWRVAARYAPRLVGAGGEDGTLPRGRRVPLTVAEWLSVAQERARQGDLRPAASALYQGFVLTLDQRGLVSFHNSKTPGDYATEIAGVSPGDADDHAPSAGRRFLDLFQDFSFGADRPTPEGYSGLEQLAREAGCTAGDAEPQPNEPPSHPPTGPRPAEQRTGPPTEPRPTESPPR